MSIIIVVTFGTCYILRLLEFFCREILTSLFRFSFGCWWCCSLLVSFPNFSVCLASATTTTVVIVVHHQSDFNSLEKCAYVSAVFLLFRSIHKSVLLVGCHYAQCIIINRSCAYEMCGLISCRKNSVCVCVLRCFLLLPFCHEIERPWSDFNSIRLANMQCNSPIYAYSISMNREKKQHFDLCTCYDRSNITHKN